MIQALIGCLSAAGVYTFYWLMTFEDRWTARGIAWSAREPVDLSELPIIPNHDYRGLV
jgi:hypothetical protein